MKNKKTKAAHLKRARRGMMGFVIKWTDKNPFDNVDQAPRDHEIDHANPTQRLICMDKWRCAAPWIVETEFTWLVIMRVVFEDAPKGDCYYDFEFTVTSTLRGKKSKPLSDAMVDGFVEANEGNNAYPEGHKNKGFYSHCEFMAQVIGVLKKCKNFLANARKRIGNLETQKRNLQIKLEQCENTASAAACFKNSDVFTMSNEIFLYCRKMQDKHEIASLILQLQNVDRFWAVFRNQPIKTIYTVLQGMKTEKGFELIINKLEKRI